MTTSSPVLVAASYDLSISLTDLSNESSSQLLSKFGLQNAQGNRILSLSNTKFVVASNPFIFLYDRSLKTNKHVTAFQGHQSNVTDLCYDDKFLYSCSEDKVWNKWDLTKVRPVSGKQTSCCLNAICLINNKTLLITGNDRGQVEVWNPQDNSLICHQKISTQAIRSISQTIDSKPIVVGSQDGKVYLIKVEGTNIEIIHTLEAHKSILTRVATSPDGKYFATASSDSTAIVWDMNTFELYYKLEDNQQTRWIWDLCFSPDSKMIVTGGTDKICRIWNLEEKKLIKSIEWHQKGVTCLTIL